MNIVLIITNADGTTVVRAVEAIDSIGVEEIMTAVDDAAKVANMRVKSILLESSSDDDEDHVRKSSKEPEA
jgi:hypothetical protein